MRAYRNRRSVHNAGEAATVERWGVNLQHARAGAAADEEAGEHRSGVGGVPFFNLIDYVDEAELAAEIVAMLRREWLPAAAAGARGGGAPPLAGLDDALRRAADPSSRQLILT